MSGRTSECVDCGAAIWPRGLRCSKCNSVRANETPRKKCKPGCKCGRHKRPDMFGNQIAVGNSKSRNTGPDNGMWKGSSACDGAKRERARRKFQIENIPCERCGKRKARERHHVDEDPGNNDRSNIELLCSSCHRKSHVSS